ncbi:hypothetical protein ABPG75_007416 [Micractinium tetrahymenae]
MEFDEPVDALERAASWLREALSWLFGPIPGSDAHWQAFCRTVKQRNEELSKAEGQRDEVRLQELTKQMLRLQAERSQCLQRQFQANQHVFLQPPRSECCNDCLLVRQRVAAACQAAAAWYKAWELITIEQLQVVEQGKPPPAMPVPPFKLRLPEGVPEQLPPSTDRCSRCQHYLDYYLDLEQELSVPASLHGDNPLSV